MMWKYIFALRFVIMRVRIYIQWALALVQRPYTERLLRHRYVIAPTCVLPTLLVVRVYLWLNPYRHGAQSLSGAEVGGFKAGGEVHLHHIAFPTPAPPCGRQKLTSQEVSITRRWDVSVHIHQLLVLCLVVSNWPITHLSLPFLTFKVYCVIRKCLYYQAYRCLSLSDSICTHHVHD